MSEHDRVATLIEKRHREHSAALRRIWGLKADGPRLAVQVLDGEQAILELRGRTRTLANRRFTWTHSGGDGTLMELLGHRDSAKPLDRQLLAIATTQALRAAVAREMGAGVTSLPATRVRIDRFVATRLVEEHGMDIMGDIAQAARIADRGEIVPMDAQVAMATCGRLQFGVAPCEVDIEEDIVRRPEIRQTSVQLSATADYIHGRLQIRRGSLPETLAIAATGRPLREVVDVGQPMLAGRIVKGVVTAGTTLIVRLEEDMVEIGEITG